MKRLLHGAVIVVACAMSSNAAPMQPRAAVVAGIQEALGVPVLEGRPLGVFRELVAARQIKNASDDALLRCAQSMLAGCPPSWVEDLCDENADLFRAQLGYDRNVKPVVGDADLLLDLGPRLLKLAADETKPFDAAQRATLARARLLVALSMRSMVGNFNAVQLVRDRSFAAKLQLSDAQLQQIDRLVAKLDIQGEREARRAEAIARFNDLVATPVDGRMDPAVLQQYLDANRTWWDICDVERESRRYALWTFARLVGYARLIKDEPALARFHEAAELLKQTTTDKTLHRWLNDALQTPPFRARPEGEGGVQKPDYYKPAKPE